MSSLVTDFFTSIFFGAAAGFLAAEAFEAGLGVGVLVLTSFAGSAFDDFDTFFEVSAFGADSFLVFEVFSVVLLEVFVALDALGVSAFLDDLTPTTFLTASAAFLPTEVFFAGALSLAFFAAGFCAIKISCGRITKARVKSKLSTGLAFKRVCVFCHRG